VSGYNSSGYDIDGYNSSGYSATTCTYTGRSSNAVYYHYNSSRPTEKHWHFRFNGSQLKSGYDSSGGNDSFYHYIGSQRYYFYKGSSRGTDGNYTVYKVCSRRYK
jgi:hypothetical protein